MSIVATAMITCFTAVLASPAEPAEVARPPASSETQPDNAVTARRGADSSLYIELRLDRPVKLSALKPGERVDGKLSRDVYSGDHKVLQSGRPIRLTVGKLQRRRREPNPNWPGVIKLFMPRHENYPSFPSATVSLPSGTEVPLQVSLIYAGYKKDLRARRRTKEKTSTRGAVSPEDRNRAADSGPTPEPASTESEAGAGGKRGGRKTQVEGPTVFLSTAGPTLEPNPAPLSVEARSASPAQLVTIAAGTQAQIILLDNLSASQNHAGDSFRASLLEPVRLGSRIVLPEGSLFEGKVVRTTPARWLSRPGSLLVAFTRLTLPGGSDATVMASLSGVALDRGSHAWMDPEGKLSAGKPGTAWMLINLGVSGGIAKETDDAAQLLIEAIISTATDVSTAGVARIVAGCASGFFMATRRGRDVVLPKFSEMAITFTRPLSVPAPPSAAAVKTRLGQGQLPGSTVAAEVTASAFNARVTARRW